MSLLGKKISTYKLFMSLYFFLTLSFVYNSSFFWILPNSNAVIYITLFLASISLVLANFRQISQRRTTTLAVATIIALLSVFRNGYILHGSYIPAIFFLFTILSAYVLSLRNDWHDIALKVLTIFIVEHIAGTLFCAAFPNFHYYHIVPLFKNSTAELLYEFSQHRISGLTNHYSINALYLMSGLLIYTPIAIQQSGKKLGLYLFLALNLIALLLTGKRLHIVAYIIILLVLLLLKYRQNLIKFIKKISTIFIVGLASVLLLVNFIPSITAPFVRAYEALGDENSMASRTVLYDFATEVFKERPLLGIGWGGYRYEFHQRMLVREGEYMNVHNIYLQVLCETGIIGAIFIYGLWTILLVLPLKDLKKTTNQKYQTFIYLFLAYHLFFLLEGTIGNSLYDLQTYYPYAITLAMYLYYHYQIKSELTHSNQKHLEAHHA